LSGLSPYLIFTTSLLALDIALMHQDTEEAHLLSPEMYLCQCRECTVSLEEVPSVSTGGRYLPKATWFRHQASERMLTTTHGVTGLTSQAPSLTLHTRAHRVTQLPS
jgi:hypothetical protein